GGIYPGKRAPAVATWIAIGTAGATEAGTAQKTVVTLPAIAALLRPHGAGRQERDRGCGQQRPTPWTRSRTIRTPHDTSPSAVTHWRATFPTVVLRKLRGWSLLTPCRV